MTGFFVNNIDFRGGLEIVTERLCDLFNQSKIPSKIYSLQGNVFPAVKYLGIMGAVQNADFENIYKVFKTDDVMRLIVQLDNPFSPVSNLDFLKFLSSKGIQICCCIHTSPVYFVKRFWNFKDSKILFYLKYLKTWFYYKPRAKSYFKKCQKYGIRLISLCEGNKKELKKYFGVDSFVIPNFYEVKDYDKSAIFHKKHSISYIGRIDYTQKNLFTLLDSWNKVSEKDDWILNVVGGGDKTALVDYIREHSIESVCIHDYMSLGELEVLYKENSILLLTSRFEGYPTVIVEAVSYGNAIITTRYAGFSDELVNDGVNGFVTGFHSDKIAECIQKLIKDESCLKEMQDASFEKRQLLKAIDYVALWEKVFKNEKNSH